MCLSLPLSLPSLYFIVFGINVVRTVKFMKSHFCNISFKTK